MSTINQTQLNNTSITSLKNWYSIDFHVHSPASTDFEGPYKGTKDKESPKAYLWLLEQAYKADLDLIVITDHNDIKGYEQIQQIHKGLIDTKENLQRVDAPIPNAIQHQLDFFEHLIILPGVELDTDPNIHLLVLFNPEKPIDEIHDFLDRAGYHRDVRGEEDISKYAQWNTKDVYREAGKLDAIVIAAHTDSSKGLYNVTNGWGQSRILAFTDENLFGMQFKNPITRDKIKNTLTDPNYARTSRLAFVQSSDFHAKRNQIIGTPRTWIRLNNGKSDIGSVFKDLKMALRNPDEYVSAPERPEVQKILNGLVHTPCIKSLESDLEIEKLVQYICAFANSEDGTFSIGKTDKKNWIGVTTEDENAFRDKINIILHNKIEPIPQFKIEIYAFGDKYIATIRTEKRPDIYYVKESDFVFIIENKLSVQASTNRIIQLAEERLLQRYAYLSITPRITKISQQLSGEQDSIDILPIVRKIELKTKTLDQLFPIPKKGTVFSSDLQEAVDFSSNGFSSGEAIVLEPCRPRFSKHYVRLTAPLGKCDLSNPVLAKIQTFIGEKLIIAPRGAVYLDTRNKTVILSKQWKPLVLQPDENYTGPDMRFILAYLKTAIPIWYAHRCLNSNDIRMNPILGKLPIPFSPMNTDVKNITNLVDDLMHAEFLFVEKENTSMESMPDEKDEDLFIQWKQERELDVDTFNQYGAEIMAKLETIFFKVFDLTQDEIAMIQKGIKSQNLATFHEKIDE